MWKLFFVWIILAASALGHSDPGGDIHPVVTTSNGVFVVTATENYFPSDPDVIGELVTRVNVKGKVLSSRRTKTPAPPFKPYRWYSYMDELPEEKNGLERKVGDVVYIIPEYGRKDDGRPYLIKVENGAFTEIDLEWLGLGMGGVSDVVFSDGKIYFYMERTSAGAPELWIHRFPMDTFKEEAAVRFKCEPVTIWGGAVTSNLIVHEGRCYFATIEKSFGGHKLLLGIWDGRSAECKNKTMTRKIDWNTSLHMANIGDDALIAYHYPGDSRSLLPIKRKDASVKTLHFKLK